MLMIAMLGYSLLVLPGGEQEMILAKPGDHSVVLKNRMGFVRLAIQKYVCHHLPNEDRSSAPAH
jgi:hypothetical protein